MQTLSQIVVLCSSPLGNLNKGVSLLYVLTTQSGIISSWILKAHLKAGRGEKLGSFWNIGMLRDYIATIWINTTGTLCINSS